MLTQNYIETLKPYRIGAIVKTIKDKNGSSPAESPGIVVGVFDIPTETSGDYGWVAVVRPERVADYLKKMQNLRINDANHYLVFFQTRIISPEDQTKTISLEERMGILLPANCLSDLSEITGESRGFGFTEAIVHNTENDCRLGSRPLEGQSHWLPEGQDHVVDGQFLGATANGKPTIFLTIQKSRPKDSRSSTDYLVCGLEENLRGDTAAISPVLPTRPGAAIHTASCLLRVYSL